MAPKKSTSKCFDPRGKRRRDAAKAKNSQATDSGKNNTTSITERKGGSKSTSKAKTTAKAKTAAITKTGSKKSKGTQDKLHHKSANIPASSSTKESADQVHGPSAPGRPEEATDPSQPPVFSVDTDIGCCKYLSMRLSQWRSHRTDLGQEPVTAVAYKQWMNGETACLAIAAVQEAMPPVTRDSFSLIPIATRVMARFGPIPPEQESRIVRPGGKILIVLEPIENEDNTGVGTAHIALAILHFDSEASSGNDCGGNKATGASITGKAKLHVLDSKPHIFQKTLPKQCADIKEMIENAGWEGPDYEPRRDRIQDVYDIDAVSEQINNWACGLHTIFNAWAYLLGLAIDTNMKPPPVKFFKDAVDIVNLAIAGLVDSATIHAFLHCYGFVLPAQQVAVDRSFRNTLHLPTERKLDVYATDERILASNKIRFADHPGVEVDPKKIRQFMSSIGARLSSPTRLSISAFQQDYLSAALSLQSSTSRPKPSSSGKSSRNLSKSGSGAGSAKGSPKASRASTPTKRSPSAGVTKPSRKSPARSRKPSTSSRKSPARSRKASTSSRGSDKDKHTNATKDSPERDATNASEKPSSIKPLFAGHSSDPVVQRTILNNCGMDVPETDEEVTEAYELNIDLITAIMESLQSAQANGQ